MKAIFTLLIIFTNALIASAQWSNTSNKFYDSLQMPVCTVAGSQLNSTVVKSYPDSGYIIFWEDSRTTGNSTDIYAQKYDKYGVALWAVNGVPVATGPGVEQIAPPSNADYRNYAHAATDSAGGFFISYQVTTQIGSYNRTGVAVQHINAAGNAMFPDAGLIIAQPLISDNNDYGMPQLVADGKNGFFVSYVRYTGGYGNYVMVEGYRLNGNSLSLYTSQRMNEDVYQRSDIGPCGFARLSLQYILPTLYDYQMWYDGQGGCNVIMNMAGADETTNTGSKRILAYNALKRVKKSCSAVTYRRSSDIANVDTVVTFYPKDSVIRLYNLQIFTWPYTCSVSTYTNYQLENFGLGYAIISSDLYDAYFAKGVTANTSGNINVSAVAISERHYINNQITPFITKMYTWPEEIYDSIPYQRTSSTQLYRAYQIFPPVSMNQLNFFQDTILNTAAYYHEFNIAATTNKIYATARLYQPSGVSHIYLQQLQINRINSDSFAIIYNTAAKTGVLIGKEKNTGFSASDISYDNPMIATDDAGNALFYIREYYRAVRVSPIINGTELAWGAMGKSLGSGIYNNSLYTTDRPFVATYKNGTGVVCWDDLKNLNPYTSDNIFMRHLDSLNVSNYLPPVKTIKLLPYGSNFALPAVLLGTSKKWSTIDTYTSGSGATSTPVIQLLDNYNLGAVDVNVYQNINAIRTYNSTPYLDRNYTIKPENNPNGAASINLRLFFTAAEFDALKAADPSIVNPGSLVVVKQPNNSINVPAAYTPVAGEEIITPASWNNVDGGYYLEIAITGFSNFFIQKASTALPVTWLGVQAQWTDTKNAKVSWQVGEQQNVKEYTVQQSEDGIVFNNACTVTASAITSYNCIVPAKTTTINYYRVLQRDIDNKFTYSKIVILRSSSAISLAVHPNPVKDRLYIDGITGYSMLQIADMSGKIIQQQNVLAGLKYIDISHLGRGMYLLTAAGDRETQTLKFVKQ
jgi:Secretion system C-terminal sorting domain